VKYPGGDDVQNVALPGEVYGMSGIVAALIPRDTIESLREDINEFSLAFIAPL